MYCIRSHDFSRTKAPGRLSARFVVFAGNVDSLRTCTLRVGLQLPLCRATSLQNATEFAYAVLETTFSTRSVSLVATAIQSRAILNNSSRSSGSLVMRAKRTHSKAEASQILSGPVLDILHPVRRT